MRTVLASALALTAMTSFALAAEAPKAPTSQPAGPVRLTDGQMGQITAGQTQRNRQRCDFAFACVQNNTQTNNQSGNNRGGDAIVFFY